MKKNRVRPIALALVRKGDRLLVAERRDESRGKTFFRPPGGKIEFGETGAEAAIREWREELGVAIVSPKLIGALENIFVFDQRPRHEIVLVYAADLADDRLYDRDIIQSPADDRGKRIAIWKAIGDFRTGQSVLYPTGLLELLAGGGLR